MHQIVEQTREERIAWYMQLPQKELAEMLVNSEEIFGIKRNSGTIIAGRSTSTSVSLDGSNPTVTYKQYPATETSTKLHNIVYKESHIHRLKEIKGVSLKDFASGHGLFWIIKNILIEQDNRINDLEYNLAELRGEVEPEN